MLLVGVKEASEILNWNRKKVSVYHPRGNFPTPITILSSGPIWFREQIEQYKKIKLKNMKVYVGKTEKYYECFYNKPPILTNRGLDSILSDSSSLFLFNFEEVEELIKKCQDIAFKGESMELNLQMATIIDFNIHLLED